MQDLQRRGCSPSTQHSYVWAVQKLARHYGKSPDLLTEQDVRAYFLHLTQVERCSCGTLKIAFSGTKFCLAVTLQRPWPALGLVRPGRESRLPVVLSRAQVRSVLQAVRAPLYRVCLSTIYACGLRISEGAALQGGQIDSQRMVLRITGTMLCHPHAHFLVTAGGLSADGQHWLEPKNPKFLLPVHAPSKIFRAKIRDGLQAAGCLTQLPARFWQSTKKWVVHAQPADSGEKLLDDLARYVFRIAITHSRLEELAHGQVTFRYRDGRTQQWRRVHLSAAQFVERFLQHVLPQGLAKVRHCGRNSSACRPRQAQARALLPSAPAAPASTKTAASGPAYLNG